MVQKYKDGTKIDLQSQPKNQLYDISDYSSIDIFTSNESI